MLNYATPALRCVEDNRKMPEPDGILDDCPRAQRRQSEQSAKETGLVRGLQDCGYRSVTFGWGTMNVVGDDSAAVDSAQLQTALGPCGARRLSRGPRVRRASVMLRSSGLGSVVWRSNPLGPVPWGGGGGVVVGVTGVDGPPGRCA